MPASHCAVPKCAWSARKAAKGEKRGLFTVYRVETDKTGQEKEHRTQLRAFLLSVRDESQCDNIANMLHREM